MMTTRRVRPVAACFRGIVRAGAAGMALAALSAALPVFADPPASPEDCVYGTTAGPDGEPTCIGAETFEEITQSHEAMAERLRQLADGEIEADFTTEFLSPSEHRLTSMPYNIPVLRVVFRTDQFFAVDGTDVLPPAIPAWRTVADSLRQAPEGTALYIVGHTDAEGSKDYNFSLGQRRAEAVAKEIVRRGAFKSRIYRLSFGETLPLAPNNTAEGRATNRRVEFLFAITPEIGRRKIEVDANKACAQSAAGNKDCAVQIVTNITEVIVDSSASGEIEKLNDEEGLILNDKSLPEAEKTNRLLQLQASRRRIPVTLKRQRIPVTLSRRLQ